MTRIHKGFPVILGAISFVHGKVEGGVVPPTVVAVELVDRHQFKGLYAEVLKVVEGVFDELEGALLREVSHQQLIDDQVFLVWFGECFICPFECGFTWSQYADRS